MSAAKLAPVLRALGITVYGRTRLAVVENHPALVPVGIEYAVYGGTPFDRARVAAILVNTIPGARRVGLTSRVYVPRRTLAGAA